MYGECHAGVALEGITSISHKERVTCSLKHIAEDLSGPSTGSRPTDGFQWAKLVTDYTRRRISCPKDRLSALSVVITVIRDITGDDCYAGIWRKNFFRLLLWHRNRSVRDFDASRDRKSILWRAPSWSFTAQEDLKVYDGNFETPARS